MPIPTEGSDYTYLPQLLDHAGGYFQRDGLRKGLFAPLPAYL